MKRIYIIMKQLSTLVLSIGLLTGAYNSAFSQSDQNTLVGYQAGMAITSGTGNTFLGSLAGNKNTTGYQNTFIGNATGKVNTTGYGNTFIGNEVGIANVNGFYNLFLGNASGKSNVSGSYNTFFGNGTGTANTTGTYNTFIGHNAGFSNVNGTTNVFMGYSAGVANTSGSYNLFLGFSAGGANTSGEFNVGLGSGSGLNNQTGGENVFIGHNAGYNTNASNNIAIGQGAGSSNINGFFNIAVGYGAGTLGTNLQNTVALGSNAQVSASNSIILGNNANVGIGNTAPGNKLEITQGTTGNSGLRFTNLTSATTSGISTNQFLTVNSTGDVVLAQVGSSKGSFRSAAGADSASLWSSDGLNLRNVNNNGGVIIGPGVMSTPTGYRLYVADGVLTEKVKVAVKSSADWSDYVFAPGYKLAPLAEVAAHIQQKGHLPGIPSAQQMVETGNDLHRTDAKLLEKIEELTLYLIQQKGELDTLRQQNQQMKARMEVLEQKVDH